MSTTFDALQKVQEKREAMRSANDKHGKSPWIIVALFSVVILSIIAANLYLFLIIKGYSADKSALSAKVDNMERTLSSTTKRLSVFSSDINKGVEQINADLDSLRANLQETNSRLLTRIERDRDAQKSALDNLAKTTDTLLSKLKSLEKEVKDLGTASIPVPVPAVTKK